MTVVNPPADHFAALGQPRRPWLDPDQLKQRYHALARTEHPDRTAQNRDVADAATLAAVNEAYRVLSNPKLRLRHLLEVEGTDTGAARSQPIPEEIADLFMKAAALVRDIETNRQKRQQGVSALGKSMLQAEVFELRSRLDEMIKELASCYDAALDDLRRIDEAWITNSSSTAGSLRILADRFAFLDRWLSELRERQFQLSI